MAMVDAACRDSGVIAEFFRSSDFAHLKAGQDAARYRLVFVLNLEAQDVPALTECLKQARVRNPAQRVLSLDARDSQADLEKAGLLTRDGAIAGIGGQTAH